MTKGWVAGLLLAGVMAAGCDMSRRGVSATPPRPVEQVDVVQLWANPPAAVNWDDVPGPDGVRLNVFLFQQDAVAPVLIKGTLELTMYAGRFGPEDLRGTRPMQTWIFTEQELATRQVSSMVGWGYAIQLGWGRNAPAMSSVTLVACYKSPKGISVKSVPLMIEIPK
jgi:hypothetical protein